ncbi:putative Crp/Fnr family transcriptional regulator [Paratrimastix pyriformis]|uniref:Crp/Fnr family transcriptional regulator n=1 Tax=Paratrimastix pyriformis TaxID=342808 RepID=A0ABQ8URL4_9EUKA|nr:putative Crp/Fnr family transcriptional regulator [Paratrimastix pyriformis]
MLFGQPPEVVKSLMHANIKQVDTFVLPDCRDRWGVLMNNLEFLLYSFLFAEGGLRSGRRLRLIGEPLHIAQVLTALRLTLTGPTQPELDHYGTDPETARELLRCALHMALKGPSGQPRAVESFFELTPFDPAGLAAVGEDFEVRRLQPDVFEVRASFLPGEPGFPAAGVGQPVASPAPDGARTGRVVVTARVDMTAFRPDEESPATPLAKGPLLQQPYPLAEDLFPSSFVQFGVVVLGSTTGFASDTASTGMVLCHNGSYILIDAIPYLDRHLKARGISLNQVTAVFLTHLHDDHCNLFQLLFTAHKASPPARPTSPTSRCPGGDCGGGLTTIDLLATAEVYRMAMTKLALGLGWQPAAVESLFNFIELRAGQELVYHGLRLVPHYTVHSIPTVGATFISRHMGREHRIVVVADNQSLAEIDRMRGLGLVRPQTADRLHEIFEGPADILIPDGACGLIHGHPQDAIRSQADRVVFVHTDRLPDQYNVTFSLAAAGKRYTAIRRYNSGDVILKQAEGTRGLVSLVLAGYCDVAGCLIGEMAVLTGAKVRNASVVARTPVVLCEFSEGTFLDVARAEGLQEGILRAWAVRDLLAQAPLLAASVALPRGFLLLTTAEAVCPAETGPLWGLVTMGLAYARSDGGKAATTLQTWAEVGPWRPFAPPGVRSVCTIEGCSLVLFPAVPLAALIAATPELAVTLRKYRQSHGGPTPWVMGSDFAGLDHPVGLVLPPAPPANSCVDDLANFISPSIFGVDMATQQQESVQIYRVLAGVLTKLVMRNDALRHGRSTPVDPSPFNALTPPEISIEAYLERLLKYMACSEECTILALIYIDRIIQFNNQSFVLTSLNIHRLLITSMVVAAKFFDDRYYTNTYYAQVGGISVAELNVMELEFLFLINFSLHVSDDHYRRYFCELKKHAVPRPSVPATSSGVRRSSSRRTMEIESPASTVSQYGHPPVVAPVAQAPAAPPAAAAAPLVYVYGGAPQPMVGYPTMAGSSSGVLPTPAHGGYLKAPLPVYTAPVAKASCPAPFGVPAGSSYSGPVCAPSSAMSHTQPQHFGGMSS